MRYKVIATGEEPVTLEDAKLYLRTIAGETDEDDSILLPMIAAAREYCENITGRAVARQTIRAYPERFGGQMRLPRPPIVRVTAIRYTDRKNEVRALNAADYAVDDIDGCVAISRAPDAPLRAINPIEIEYESGYEETPRAIRQAMLLLIGHWYTNREAVATGAVATVEVDMTTRALLRQYKVWWF